MGATTNAEPKRLRTTPCQKGQQTDQAQIVRGKFEEKERRMKRFPFDENCKSGERRRGGDSGGDMKRWENNNMFYAE